MQLTERQEERLQRSATNSARWYLSRGERSRREIEQRLRRNRRDIPPHLVGRALDELEAGGLLDDTHYAETLVRRGMGSRRLGSRRIQQDMRQRGIATEIIEEAIATIDPDSEEANARDFLAKRIRQVKDWSDPWKTRNNLAGAMARRGYGGNLVYPLISELVEVRLAEIAAEAEEEDF